MFRQEQNPTPRGKSIHALLKAQPAGVRKHHDFKKLENILKASPALQRVILDTNSWHLLKVTSLEPRYLDNFMHTYHLPERAFFELFLNIKQQYRSDLDLKIIVRRRRVEALTKNYPSRVLSAFSYLARLEASRNTKIPVWRKKLFPGTLKRAEELTEFSNDQWKALFSSHLDELEVFYLRILLPEKQTFFYYLILECFPDPASGKAPSPNRMKESFRKHIREYHPDQGGDPDLFLELKAAYESLSSG
jgi:hypothetical protein